MLAILFLFALLIQLFFKSKILIIISTRIEDY